VLFACDFGLSRKQFPMSKPRRIEGYAIVSEDGMLANAAGIMPESLKFEADQHFFERGLDAADVVVSWTPLPRAAAAFVFASPVSLDAAKPVHRRRPFE
jgi:hypothetical protein